MNANQRVPLFFGPKGRAFLVFVICLCCALECIAQSTSPPLTGWLNKIPEIDLPALRGAKRADVERQFPKARWIKVPYSADSYYDRLSQSGPYKEIGFYYGTELGSNVLSRVNFVLNDMLTEAQVVSLLTERLKVKLQNNVRESQSTLIAWEGMVGPIRTVMLFLKLSRPKNSQELAELLANPTARNSINSGAVERFSVDFAR